MPVLVEKLKDALEHLEMNGPSERYRINGSSISVKIKKDKNLKGEDQFYLEQIGDGAIIKLFDMTPSPQNDTDVVCPHFVELKWANGCYFDCAWCFLNGTFRFQERGKKPFLKPPKKIKSHIGSLFSQWNQPTILNSGELSDSLVFEGHEYSLTKDIIPLFKNQKQHKLLILTKSSNVEGIISSYSQNVVIPAFSINAYSVAERWEKYTPHPRARIKAAKKLFNEGYDVRVRLDPMVPVETWEADYLQVVDDIFKEFYPERITLGSLRGLQSTINFCTDKSWVGYLEGGRGSNWGKKINNRTRYNMYKTIIRHLNEEHNYNKIALCKETVSMWKKLKLKYDEIRCNCIF